MGIHDRQYWREEQPGGYGGGGGGGLQLGLPKPGRVVKWLLIINIAVFLVQIFRPEWMGVFAVVPAYWWQIWRYLTFQFLHGFPMHLGFNMLGLYFLGMVLERSWGSKSFLRFYLICGAAAGLAHVLLSLVFRADLRIPLVGASGGVFAVLVACAILFPHIRVIVFLFPMSIRAAALLFLGIAVIGILMSVRSALAGGGESGGIAHMAHLGGAIAGAFWIWVLPRMRGSLRGTRAKLNQGAWERKMGKRRTEQGEIDRILDKIQREGLNSLSRKERSRLREATRTQHEDERDLHRL